MHRECLRWVLENVVIRFRGIKIRNVCEIRQNRIEQNRVSSIHPHPCYICMAGQDRVEQEQEQQPFFS